MIEFLSVEDVAERLKIAKRTVRWRIESGSLRAERRRGPSGKTSELLVYVSDVHDMEKGPLDQSLFVPMSEAARRAKLPQYTVSRAFKAGRIRFMNQKGRKHPVVYIPDCEALSRSEQSVVLDLLAEIFEAK